MRVFPGPWLPLAQTTVWETLLGSQTDANLIAAIAENVNADLLDELGIRLVGNAFSPFELVLRFTPNVIPVLKQATFEIVIGTISGLEVTLNTITIVDADGNPVVTFEPNEIIPSVGYTKYSFVQTSEPTYSNGEFFDATINFDVDLMDGGNVAIGAVNLVFDDEPGGQSSSGTAILLMMCGP